MKVFGFFRLGFEAEVAGFAAGDLGAGDGDGNLNAADISAVQDKLNSRPRKCLDYATPNDIFIAPPPIALAA